MKPRLLIVDDHRLMVEGLSKLLEDQFEIVGQAADGVSALNAAKNLHPDLVLLDICLPGMNGLEVARKIREEARDTKILILSVQSSRVYVEEAFRAGASGYLLKQCAGQELVLAIRQILSGRRFVTPSLGEALVRREVKPDNGATSSFRLTSRQQQVLQLVVEGHSMKEIASILHISPKTVEFHKANLMRDIGARSSGELIRFALENHLVNEASFAPA
jgi:DNA-binding NarL/FixJ family response regulator